MLGSNPSADSRTRPKRGAKHGAPFLFCPKLRDGHQSDKSINEMAPFLFRSVTEPFLFSELID